MKHKIKILFFLLFAIMAFKAKSQVYYPRIYPYPVSPGIIQQANNPAGFRNYFILQKNAVDSTWWFVDDKGNGALVSGNLGGGGGSSDKDFLRISNDEPPSAVSGQPQYTKNNTTVGARYTIPRQDFSVVDSFGDVNLINSGNRNAQITNYNNLAGTWSQISQIGNELVFLAGNGTDQIRVKINGGTDPTIPSVGKTVLNYNKADSSWYFSTYPDTRNDAITPFNFLSTTTGGRLVSLPFSSLPGGVQAYQFGNPTPGTSPGITPDAQYGPFISWNFDALEGWKWNFFTSNWDLIQTGPETFYTSAEMTGDGTPFTPLELAQQGATGGQVLAWDVPTTSYKPITISAGTVTGGNNGTSLSGSNIQLGNANGGTSAQLTSGREIPLNGKKLSLSGNTGQLIVGDTIAKTWSSPSGNLHPKLFISNLSTSISNTEPLFGMKTLSDSEILYEFNPKNIDTTALPYSFSYGIARNIQPGINDFSLSWGQNKTAGGARRDLTKPSWTRTVEGKYEISGHGKAMEFYNDMTAINGASVRWFEFYANRDSLYNASLFMSARQMAWRSLAGADIMTLTLPRTSATTTLLGLHPGAGSGSVYLDFNGLGAITNIIRMKRPTGLTGAGTLDDQLSVGSFASKSITRVGNNSGSVGVLSGRLVMNPDGGTSAIVRNTSFFTVHIGTTTNNSLFSDATATVLQINGNTQYQDAYPLSNGGNDLLRLWHNGKNEGWGLGVETNGLTFGKAQTTAGLYSMWLRDQTATDFNLKIYGAVGITIPGGQTSNRSSAPIRGEFRVNFQTRKFEGVRVGTIYEPFFQLGDTLGATNGQVLTYNSGAWNPATNTSESTKVGVFNNTGTAQGLVMSGDSIKMTAASSTQPGGVNIISQTFQAGTNGFKTFTSDNGFQVSADDSGATKAAGYQYSESGGSVVLAQTLSASPDANSGTWDLKVRESASMTDQIKIRTAGQYKGVYQNGRSFSELKEVGNGVLTSYNIGDGDNAIILATAIVVINLQVIGTGATETPNGGDIFIYNPNAVACVITPQSGQTIDGAATLTLSQNKGIFLKAVNTASYTMWITIGN